MSEAQLAALPEFEASELFDERCKAALAYAEAMTRSDLGVDDVRAELPSGANLVPGNEVRLGGTRVGVIEDITPRRLPDGRVVAVLDLALDEALAPLPADSTVLVRSRSTLGLKYLELRRGTAARTLAATRRFHAIVALGCVIRGETPHFEYVSQAATHGLQRVALDTGVPVVFGVLTTDTIEQAIERAGTKAGNKGFEAALTAIEMADLLRQLPKGPGAASVGQ